MKIIKADIEILSPIDGQEILKRIEQAGRVCYKSEDKITDGSAERFVANILKRGHEAVLEHQSITVKFICDRGVSHEIVRHRLAAYCQESTRYCNYSKDGFGNEITVVEPCFLEHDTPQWAAWESAMKNAEFSYFRILWFSISLPLPTIHKWFQVKGIIAREPLSANKPKTSIPIAAMVIILWYSHQTMV